MRDVKNRNNQPKKIVIMSTWGAGSGTLSSILLKHLNAYFHQEPLHYFGGRQVETVSDTIEAKRVIEALLKCEYRNPVLAKYLYHARFQWPRQFQSNPSILKGCSSLRNSDCFDQGYLQHQCQNYNIQVMRILRLRLHHLEELLKDRGMDMRVLFLIRDPRGTLQSRMDTIKSCAQFLSCHCSTTLCRHLSDDWTSFRSLRAQFPGHVWAIRFEDLHGNREDTMRKLLTFLDLEMDLSTRMSILSKIFTSQNNKIDPFESALDWRKQLSGMNASAIDKNCRSKMSPMGYLTCDGKVPLTKCDPLQRNMNLNPLRLATNLGFA
ncbi:uncharacterized protein LOC131885590 isoform X1 [Tigriopus californicus]|uniref:uncharacterized protein LOC131885590 isoform X1 n=1 Tax=Tigriopus californicus TaxID=6832 RepID=UPI0027DAAF90|nr:uncharacterized protein LOC131885590 isoform X1 [Tigriopus californicus]